MSDEEFELAYNNAPQEVKDLLDNFGEAESYEQLAKLQDELKLLGYDMDYYLDCSITMLKPSEGV